MRHAALVATVALFLLITVHPRAQAPALNRDVAPTLPVKQLAYIRASNAEPLDHFGCGGGNQGHTGTSIAMSGDGMTMAVGAPFESGGAAGINGNQNDNSVYAAGAVYVYTRSGNSWTQQAYVKASNPGANDHFGSSVALSRDGNTMAVAAHWESSGATGINGNQNDDSIPQAGAVYVFTRTGTGWTQQAYVKASNTGKADEGNTPGDGDQFGFSLALSGDGNTMAVGAITEDSGAQGINGNEKDDAALSAGAVYVFARMGTTWRQQAYVKPATNEAGDLFGFSVGLSADGNTLAAAAFNESSSGRGINPPHDNKFGQSGALFVFTRQNGSWSQQAFIKGSRSEPSDGFGFATSISDDGNTIAVGAGDEACLTPGIRPPNLTQFLIQEIFNAWREHKNEAEESGAMYLFTRTAGKWTAGAYIKGDNTDAGDEFGSAVAISDDGHTVVAGAHQEDGPNNAVADSGAAYVFAY